MFKWKHINKKALSHRNRVSGKVECRNWTEPEREMETEISPEETVARAIANTDGFWGNAGEYDPEDIREENGLVVFEVGYYTLGFRKEFIPMYINTGIIPNVMVIDAPEW